MEEDQSFNSVTLMISQLQGGDEQAAEEIWQRFFGSVVGLARRKLGAIPKRISDEEDIALSAMNAFYVGVRDQKFQKLKTRDDLWQILCMLTSRKAASAWRKQLARKDVVGESAIIARRQDEAGIAYIASETPDEQFVGLLSQRCKELLETLDERLREVAILRLQGYRNEEIAERIGRSVKSVERYMATIRQEWSEYA